MRISIERSGGFTGMRMSFTLSEDMLSQDEMQKIQDIINQANFFEITPKTPAPPGAADYFQYKITVESDEKSHTIETNDISMQESLAPLIEFLEEKKRNMNEQSNN